MSFSAFEALESLMRQRHQRSYEQLSRIARHQLREATNPNKLIPSVELTENRDCIRVMVDLPGVLAQDIDVTIDHGVLCIQGSRKIMDVNNAVCVKKQKFTRRYALDTDVVDVAHATATLSNGVLTFKAPKNSKKPQVVRIPVLEIQNSNNNNNNATEALVATIQQPHEAEEVEKMQEEVHDEKKKASMTTTPTAAAARTVSSSSSEEYTSSTTTTSPLVREIDSSSTEHEVVEPCSSDSSASAFSSPTIVQEEESDNNNNQKKQPIASSSETATGTLSSVASGAGLCTKESGDR